MNKPLKLLLIVGVLAFAAAGLYYAMVSPARPSKAEGKLTRQDQSSTPKFDGGDTRAPTVVVGKEPAGSWPSPLPSEKPAAPAASSVEAAPNATSPAAATPPGFSPAPEPMKPLPSALPGFEPVQADGAPAKSPPANAITPGSPAPNVVPATPLAPATPVGGSTAPSSAGTLATRPVPTPAPASLPSLPAPAKPVVAPPPTTVSAPASKATGADTYTVKEGDSIASIWRTVSGSERGWEKLLAANPGVDPSRLKIGQVLKVPDHKSTGAGEAHESAPAATSKSAPAAGTYVVQSGDTLSRIAGKTLGDSKRWKEIYEANREALGNDPGALEVGQTLKIPGKAAAAKTPASKPVEKPAESKPAPTAAPASQPAGVIGGGAMPPPSSTSTTSGSPAASPAPR